MKEFQPGPVSSGHIPAVNLELTAIPVTDLLQHIGQQLNFPLRKTGNSPVSTKMCHLTFHIN
jgi:hypothetical protein